MGHTRIIFVNLALYTRGATVQCLQLPTEYSIKTALIYHQRAEGKSRKNFSCLLLFCYFHLAAVTSVVSHWIRYRLWPFGWPWATHLSVPLFCFPSVVSFKSTAENYAELILSLESIFRPSRTPPLAVNSRILGSWLSYCSVTRCLTSVAH